jgi:hypothetical protein
LPPGEEQRRQSILADNAQPPKPSIDYPANGASLYGNVDIKFNASDKYLSAVLLLINNTLKADGPWDWQNNSQVEVQGSYSWDSTSIPAGPYEIKILAFDEHGATNGPSITTITVNVVPWNPKTLIFPTRPPEESIMSPPPSTPPNNEPNVPSAAPPPDTAPKKPQTSSGLSLPREYVYGIAVSLASILAIIAVHLYSKRKK